MSHKYSKEITELLESNKNNWRKQQLTARRVYDLLCEAQADFDISYTSVLRFVQKWKKEQIQVAIKNIFVAKMCNFLKIISAKMCKLC